MKIGIQITMVYKRPFSGPREKTIPHSKKFGNSLFIHHKFVEEEVPADDDGDHDDFGEVGDDV